MPIKVAGLQTQGTLGDIEANLVELTGAAEEAAAAGVDLLITPEMFITGYALSGRLPDLAGVDFLGPVSALARRLGLAILLGGPAPTERGIHNAAWFIDDTGELLGCYRKSHLFGRLDREQFVEGDEPFALVEFKGVRIAVMICYDIEFPEVVRAAALAGAHLLAVPTAQMTPFAFVAESLVPTRAWENQVYVAYVDHDGVEGDLTYVGRSSIVAPDATVLAHLEHGTGLVTATVDPAVVEAQQAVNPYLADRRPALYDALTKEP